MGTTACTRDHCLGMLGHVHLQTLHAWTMAGQTHVACLLQPVCCGLKSTYNTDLCSTEDSQPGLYQLGGCLRRVTAHICCPR